jgi:ComF family protein
LEKRLRILFSDTFETKVTLIIPVPLSKRRRFERGFNQAAMLGRILSRASTIPMDEFSLVRKIHTQKHRAAMDSKKREITVRKAFEVKRPKMIDGQHILLVDDILTSGATASYCAKALKKNGAASVNVLTLARAVATLK